MFTITDDLSIYVTRGDIVHLNVSAVNESGAYKFKVGDVVRLKIFAKKDCSDIIFQKDFPVTKESETAEIFLTGHETRIGGLINKHSDYWYEIELNPESNPQTIIGYDEDGAKVFRLFPEGRTLDKEEPEITPEDVAILDDELDITSLKPVENRAIVRGIERTAQRVTKELNNKITENITSLQNYITSEHSDIRGTITNATSNITHDLNEFKDLVNNGHRTEYLGRFEDLETQIDETNLSLEEHGQLLSTHDGKIANMLSNAQPYGTVYTTTFEHIKPANLFGGEWELIDKEFKTARYYIKDEDELKKYISCIGNTIGTNMNVKLLHLEYSGHSITCTINGTPTVGFDDYATLLFGFNLPETEAYENPWGIIKSKDSSDKYENIIYPRYVVGMSDEGAVMCMLKVYTNSTTGQIEVEVHETIPSESNALLQGKDFQFTFTMDFLPKNMRDYFCNKFYWRRIN